MTDRCEHPDCNRPFGLVRSDRHFGDFCSTRCWENYRRQQERNRAYWRWLYKFPEPSVAGQK
jgi:hypothetical protein